ncbi:hypothetical protein C5Y97_17625 [Blastopirellula marina]|uniref:Uncharacterized protein n=1 Tax=Blastopirellula marina TaxID=124 RepID=A0A2S8FL96_9BACT|nr:hypothetical protein C5Y98_17615 [Blastopirellula marina]PTL43125.1 hypothetical protein C5Y97_17625 [Blastopirellula marina]
MAVLWTKFPAIAWLDFLPLFADKRSIVLWGHAGSENRGQVYRKKLPFDLCSCSARKKDFGGLSTTKE